MLRSRRGAVHSRTRIALMITSYGDGISRSRGESKMCMDVQDRFASLTVAFASRALLNNELYSRRSRRKHGYQLAEVPCTLAKAAPAPGLKRSVRLNNVTMRTDKPCPVSVWTPSDLGNCVPVLLWRLRNEGASSTERHCPAAVADAGLQAHYSMANAGCMSTPDRLWETDCERVC